MKISQHIKHTYVPGKILLCVTVGMHAIMFTALT
jgi:hypothetical protein